MNYPIGQVDDVGLLFGIPDDQRADCANDLESKEDIKTESKIVRNAGSTANGTSDGKRLFELDYLGSDITKGTMYGTMSTYYNSVQDFAENLEDFLDFGSGEQVRVMVLIQHITRFGGM